MHIFGLIKYSLIAYFYIFPDMGKSNVHNTVIAKICHLYFQSQLQHFRRSLAQKFASQHPHILPPPALRKGDWTCKGSQPLLMLISATSCVIQAI